MRPWVPGTFAGMSNDAHEKDISARFAPRPPGERNAPPPPPRPQVSNLTPPPSRPEVPPPGTVIASRSLWIAGFLSGLIALGIVFYGRDGVLDGLQDRIGDLAPDESDDTLERVAGVVYWSTMSAMLVVIITEWVLVGRMMRRRGGARWALLLVLVVHAAVALLADAFLGLGDLGAYLRLLFWAQLLLSGVALIVSLLPAAGRWFRTRKQPGDRAAG